MGKALYRKHRPKKLSEIIGQQHITDTLGNALKTGLVSHAYLLTGPRGVGKTSIARILAYEVNKLPYDEEGTHLDIIEIDAASNRRIDEIRELKERVNIAPTSATYKVYIIDEVHMLTKEAFNALLKTLEEPPEHVIFILATTEAHKVPDTIISRTQRFSLKPIDTELVVAHLKEIAASEKIVIDGAALELIAAHGEGSFRDSISLLDQVRHSSPNIKLEHVQQAIGQAPDHLLDNLLGAVNAADIPAVSAGLAELQAHGVQANQIARQLAKKLRHSLLHPDTGVQLPQALALLGELINVSASQDSALSLELALYNTALNSQTTETPAKVATAAPPTAPVKVAESAPVASPREKTSEKPASFDALNDESWQAVLAAIKAKHNTLYGIARMATPTFNDQKLTLGFSFAFHKKKLNDSKNRQLLQDVITQITGQDIVIECVLNSVAEVVTEERPAVKVPAQANLEAISNIFGGAEIVE